MAMADLFASRSTYLQEAAHLLAVSSPSASAFLGSARTRLIRDAATDVPTRDLDALHRETCGACGSLLVPGWSCEVSNKSQIQRRRRNGQSKPNNAATLKTNVVYHCLRCRRKTEQKLPPQPRRQPKKIESPVASISGTTTSKSVKDDKKTLKTANASSKQRQKARKGGLQAMLEKNKSQSSSVGLDLMDFAM
jgi:RNase P subunit RPR2